MRSAFAGRMETSSGRTGALLAVLLLCACNRNTPAPGKPEPAGAQRQKDRVWATDKSKRTRPIPSVPGTECREPADCFEQQAGHGTWCGPVERDFSEATVDAVYVPGTLDGTRAPTGEEVGCRCVVGWCGALLNDGRLVIGPQPEVYGTDVEYTTGNDEPMEMFEEIGRSVPRSRAAEPHHR